jgi:simple sugar transport system permease protein
VTVAEAQEPTPRGATGWRLAGWFVRRREASVLLVALALVLYFSLASSSFFTADIFRAMTEFGAPIAIIAAGEVMLLVCGEIDLSVGFVFSFSAWIMYFANSGGIPIVIAVLLGLAAAAVVGLGNGIVTVLVGVPSFITTLGTALLLSGIVLVTSNGFPVDTPGGHTFTAVMGNHPYSMFYWTLGVIVVMHVVLSRTRFGLHTIAVGGNLVGASESGVNVRRVKVSNFVICSMLGGFAGIINSVFITSIQPNQGSFDVMFSAVAAAVIGGTSLMGGSGTILGAFLGVAVLSILSLGFNVVGVSAFYFNLVQGAAILLAMVMNVSLQRLRNLGRLQ